ncbi:MAG: nucleotidyltransferase domain-containing protein [Chloroflexi bacterium]|nr:nucleotidyltransferase domain-containing protein [Chloroflexota bacterium]
MPSREEILRILRDALPELRQRYGVTRLALYGSFAYGRPGPRSDVDLLVELEQPLGLEFISMVYSLEEKLGRKVEVATFDALRRGRQHPRNREAAQNIERTLLDVAATP